MSVAAIVGSAFSSISMEEKGWFPQKIHTSRGWVTMYRDSTASHDAFLLFRHGHPHSFLPNQIPYRAHTEALREVGCQALLVTSSVGVLVPELPLFEPLLVHDLLMPDNRLPDGSACSMFQEPVEGQGHLVLEEGLFSRSLQRQIRQMAEELQTPIGGEAVFAYVGGPRTKTGAENVYWARMGAQVNSMTLGPEVVLANEYEIPTAALVVGHKYSILGHSDPFAQETVTSSLHRSRSMMEQLVKEFLRGVKPPPYSNQIYRFREREKSS